MPKHVSHSQTGIQNHHRIMNAKALRPCGELNWCARCSSSRQDAERRNKNIPANFGKNYLHTTTFTTGSQLLSFEHAHSPSDIVSTAQYLAGSNMLFTMEKIGKCPTNNPTKLCHRKCKSPQNSVCILNPSQFHKQNNHFQVSRGESKNSFAGFVNNCAGQLSHVIGRKKIQPACHKEN